MVNPQDIITAAAYNALQTRVRTVLGTATGDSGYGQDVVSRPVNPTDVVTAENMRVLNADLNTVSTHQFGYGAGLNTVNPQDKIGSNGSGGDTTKGFNDYENKIASLETTRFNLAATESIINQGTENTRITPWSTQVVHEFYIEFPGYTTAGGKYIGPLNHRRAFFNAGGQIHMSATIEGDNTAKGADWNTILTNMGTIKFSATTTEKTGSAGLLQPIGNNDLTTSYQKIFERRGQADYYAENRFFMYAKETSNRAIQFSIEFEDNDVGDPNDDELIRGTLTSVVKQLRPTGSYVSVKSPAYSTQSDISEGD